MLFCNRGETTELCVTKGGKTDKRTEGGGTYLQKVGFQLSKQTECHFSDKTGSYT